jgi:protein-tyrosine phosphatase
LRLNGSNKHNHHTVFSFFRKPAHLLSYSFLAVDLHSHLIPGIDDGAKTIEDSLALIRALHGLGYRKLITTPHVMSDLYPNGPENIREGLKALRQAIKWEGIEIEIEAAAEYMLDEMFSEKLETGQLLTLPGKRVLVEMSFVSPPMELDSLLFRIQSRGYQPLLAHPERYLFFKDNFSKYLELKERGCEFQLNILSLTGYYGKPVKDNAYRLLKEGLIDFLGTDLHHERHAEQLRLALEDRRLASALLKHKFANRELL